MEEEEKKVYFFIIIYMFYIDQGCRQTLLITSGFDYINLIFPVIIDFSDIPCIQQQKWLAAEISSIHLSPFPII